MLSHSLVPVQLTLHTLTAKDANQKVMLTIDNMLQSPISETNIVTTLSAEAAAADEIVEFSGITSFFAGDYVRVGAADTGEILKIKSIGIGKTNGIKVERSWVGTRLNSHGIGSTVTKMRGHYNIVGNTVNFVEAPYGNRPIGSISIHRHLETGLVSHLPLLSLEDHLSEMPLLDQLKILTLKTSYTMISVVNSMDRQKTSH